MPIAKPGILIVDDRPANRKMLARVLGTLDVTVCEASSGQEALRIARENQDLCVALLDVRMPGMDGYTLATELRQTVSGSALPLIFISAIETGTNHHLRGYELGAVDYLNKPVSPRILLSKVRVFLELFLKRREIEAANAALQRQTARLETTAELSHRITSILDLDDLLVEFLSLVEERFGYRYSGIWMQDAGPGSRTIGLRASNYGTRQPVLKPGSAIPVDADRSIIAHVYRTGATYYTNDTRSDPIYLRSEGLDNIRSELALPLFFGRSLLGVMDIQSETVGAFSAGDIAAVSVLADQVAVALRNTTLYSEIRRLNEDLESQVAQRTTELQQAYQQLELLDRSKSDFITVVSHELRTPLTLVSGFSQMLNDDHEVVADPFRRQQIEGIVNGAERMRAIVDSMLDVVKIDSRTLRLDRGSIDLHELLTTLAIGLGPAVQRRNQTLKIQDVENLPRIEGDGTEIIKVFDELLSNAMKYTPDGGRVTISGRLLDEAASDREAYVEIIVADTGIGISPDHLDLIFAKFYRTGDVTLHSSGRTKYKAGGPGLGLAVARGIVDAHGGRIWGESPGHDELTFPGSEFHVILPVKQPPL